MGDFYLKNLLLSFLLCSCATLVKNKKQKVSFLHPPLVGSVSIKLADGNYILKDKKLEVYLDRNIEDELALVTCPDGKVLSVKIHSEYDFIVAGVGNLFNFGIGFFIDPFMNKAYNFKDSDIGKECGYNYEKIIPMRKNLL